MIKKVKEHKSFDGYTRFYEHESKYTKTKMKFSSFEPEKKADKALIWLSGLTCTEENFIAKAGAQKYLSELGIMLICPDTSPRGLDLPGEHDVFYFGSGAGFYLNATTEGYKDHYQMYSYINEEIYSILENDFGIKKISIFGHSMGGHGAISIALRNPDKYHSVSAFAPIVGLTKSPWGEYGAIRYLGEDRSKWKEYDSVELIKEGYRFSKKILIDQGTSDELLKEHIDLDGFQQACKESGQELKLNYREGYDHGYYFISTFIEDHVRFHVEELIYGA